MEIVQIYEVSWIEVRKMKMTAKTKATDADNAIELVGSGCTIEQVEIEEEIDYLEWRATEVDE